MYVEKMYRIFSRLSQHTAYGVRLCSSSSNNAVQQRIEGLIKDSKVVLFMKGTPSEPMCGFSRAVVQIMDVNGVDRDKDLTAHNVLEDQDLREGEC